MAAAESCVGENKKLLEVSAHDGGIFRVRSDMEGRTTRKVMWSTGRDVSDTCTSPPLHTQLDLLDFDKPA